MGLKLETEFLSSVFLYIDKIVGKNTISDSMFKPQRIIFLKNTLDYEIGRDVYQFFKNNHKVEIILSQGSTIGKYFDKEDFSNFFQEGKKTLVLGLTKATTFQSCKPSAHYQLPLVSGCMGQCEYCYLQTQLSKHPFIKVNVNLEDIFARVENYINEFPDRITIFEGSATSDVLPLEPYTKILSKTINYFSKSEKGRFRFVSKFTDVDQLIPLKHNDHTEIRFSLNTDTIIKQYEHLTPSAKKRIEAAKKVLEANYRVGFLIAPVFLYPNYQEDYQNLLKMLKDSIKGYEDKVTFEIISHRFTSRAKQAIQTIFPDTTLDLNEGNRKFKMGQFGYGKYVYKNEDLKEMKEFFQRTLSNIFPNSEILYII